jgi:cell division protein FtsB
MAQVCEILASANWCVFPGADAKKVAEAELELPIDATASPATVALRVEKLEAEISTLKSENARIPTLKAENTKLKGENAQIPALRAEIARLMSENAQIPALKAENAQNPARKAENSRLKAEIARMDGSPVAAAEEPPVADEEPAPAEEGEAPGAACVPDMAAEDQIISGSVAEAYAAVLKEGLGAREPLRLL